MHMTDMNDHGGEDDGVANTPPLVQPAEAMTFTHTTAATITTHTYEPPEAGSKGATGLAEDLEFLRSLSTTPTVEEVVTAFEAFLSLIEQWGDRAELLGFGASVGHPEFVGDAMDLLFRCRRAADACSMMAAGHVSNLGDGVPVGIAARTLIEAITHSLGLAWNLQECERMTYTTG